MAQHFLQTAQVRSAREQMAGKAMPQCMNSHFARKPGAAGIFFDYAPDIDPGHSSAGAGKKEEVAAGGLEEAGAKVLQIQLCYLNGYFSEGDDALLVTFSETAKITDGKVQGRNLKPCDLTCPHTRCVEHLEESFIPKVKRVVGGRGVK